MRSDLMLVGSAPLETAEDVFRTFGPALGEFLGAMPDGEVGARRWWTIRVQFQVFNGHPQLETINRPKPDDGVERLVPRDLSEPWQFRVRDGVAAVKFGNPGWRLGFAWDAITSYFIFKTLRKEGVIPKHVRFQVAMPAVNSVVTPRAFPNKGDLEKVRPGYEEALAAEIETIVRSIPHEDLALQWDFSWEITHVYGALPGASDQDAIAHNTAQIRHLARHVPESVPLGFHWCFGTFGGWPRFAPDDLGRAVELSNAAVEAAGRRIDWIHIPTLDRSDDAFYRPLQNLRPGSARVYLGMIHSMPTFKARLAMARKYLPDFGIGAYCGFGRQNPADMPKVIEDHRQAMKMFRNL